MCVALRRDVYAEFLNHPRGVCAIVDPAADGCSACRGERGCGCAHGGDETMRVKDCRGRVLGEKEQYSHFSSSQGDQMEDGGEDVWAAGVVSRDVSCLFCFLCRGSGWFRSCASCTSSRDAWSLFWFFIARLATSQSRLNRSYPCFVSCSAAVRDARHLLPFYLTDNVTITIGPKSLELCQLFWCIPTARAPVLLFFVMTTTPRSRNLLIVFRRFAESRGASRPFYCFIS